MEFMSTGKSFYIPNIATLGCGVRVMVYVLNIVTLGGQSCMSDRLLVLADTCYPILVIGISAKFHPVAPLLKNKPGFHSSSPHITSTVMS